MDPGLRDGRLRHDDGGRIERARPFGKPVDVRLPGGWLKITVDEKLEYVLMEGPAELVFQGETERLR